MSKLKECRQRKADLESELTVIGKQTTAIGMGAVKAKRAMSDAERDQLGTLHARKEELQDALAENSELLAAAEAANEAERYAPAASDPDADASRQAAARAGLHMDSFHASPVPTRARGARYADLFPRTPLSADGWNDSSEFLATITAGLADPRLRSAALNAGRMSATATERIPSDGGFSVPTEFSSRWLDSSIPSEIIRPRCTIYPMTSSSIRVPAWEETGAEELGGWTPEAQEISPDTPPMRAIVLQARKNAVLVEVSLELLADGIGYAEQLDAKMIRGVGRNFDRAFLRGTGANEPLGILNAPATITVAAESGQAADTVSYENIVNMFARILPSSIGRSIWLANPTTIPQLLTLSQAIGTAGSVVNVLNQANGEFRMLTRPVVFTDLLPAVGDAGDLMLIDPTAYICGLRQDIMLDRSNSPGFTRATTYFRLIIRADGQPGLAAPFQPDTGDTLSPFVKLGARS